MQTVRKCPLCAEEINVDAIKCKHCGGATGITLDAQQKIDFFLKHGFQIKFKDEKLTQLIKPKKFSFGWAFFWALFYGVGFFIYLLYFLAKRDEIVNVHHNYINSGKWDDLNRAYLANALSSSRVNFFSSGSSKATLTESQKKSLVIFFVVVIFVFVILVCSLFFLHFCLRNSPENNENQLSNGVSDASSPMKDEPNFIAVNGQVIPNPKKTTKVVAKA